MSKVKVTGSQSAKPIEGDRVAGVSYALYQVVIAPPTCIVRTLASAIHFLAFCMADEMG